MKDVLIVQYAKWPQLGKVKTRLAKSLGKQKALDVHMQLLAAVFNNLRTNESGKFELWLNENGFNLDASILSTEEIDIQESMKELIANANVAYQLQQGASLGDKMAHTLETSLISFEKVIIVGSDCPNVSPEIISQAVAELNDHDLVLGPAEDGGYVLIGASRFEPGIFTDVAWGQGQVLKKTLSNAKDLSYGVALLDESWDVDELEDYERWLNLDCHYSK